MRSLNHFVCEPKNGDRYITESSNGLIASTSDEDHSATNRIAVVKSVPMKYKGKIEAGDEIIVHHNIFRVYGDMKGKQKTSYAHLFGDNYLIDPFDIYAYRKPNGKWTSIDPYIFVAVTDKENNIATVVYNSDNQLKAGDVIGYKPHILYEFNINGKIVYRMKSINVCLISEKKY